MIDIQQGGGGTIAELAATSNRFFGAARADQGPEGLNSTPRLTPPQLYVHRKGEKTSTMGIRLPDQPF